ncbi:MAG: T9SS type A sorting domain-containing protein, partial [Bacteroidota bacterium]
SRESQVAYYNDELQGAVLNGVTYGNLSSVELISSLVPNHTQLHANYPNPFNAETNVQFSINYPTNISLIVYDLIGRKVAILHEGAIEPGLYRTRWKPDGVSTGIYILRLQTSTNSFEKKVLYLK